MAGHNCSGSLLHLPRFHVERKPKILYLTEKVILYLKTQPQHIAEYSKIREVLGFTHSFRNLLKNLLKTYDFQRYIKTDLVSDYIILPRSGNLITKQRNLILCLKHLHQE
ncbi:hypothetical protein PR048_016917 [Dryococelus australis]|uniref:Maturase K n=1 Tax=Dryococelus australis TaxID=614101 RepID=A0ABQ9H8L6_9NEOP|nr:hypothetical protein PR048_016917 [Dryococelus australis]